MKRLHIFLESIGFIGFTRLCSGFMSGSISVLLVLHACQQNQPGCCRGGRSGQSLILCLTYRCVHPAQKLYENTMFLTKSPSLHNPLNEIFFSKKYMKTYTAGEKSLSGGLHLTTFFSPKVIRKHIVPEQNR